MIDKATPEMMPCPFCGGHDIRVSLRKTCIVECRGCGAMFIKVRQPDAVEAWNTRHFGSVVKTCQANLSHQSDACSPVIDDERASVKTDPQKPA